MAERKTRPANAIPIPRGGGARGPRIVLPPVANDNRLPLNARIVRWAMLAAAFALALWLVRSLAG